MPSLNSASSVLAEAIAGAVRPTVYPPSAKLASAVNTSQRPEANAMLAEVSCQAVAGDASDNPMAKPNVSRTAPSAAAASTPAKIEPHPTRVVVVKVVGLAAGVAGASTGSTEAMGLSMIGPSV